MLLGQPSTAMTASMGAIPTCEFMCQCVRMRR